MEVKKYYQNEPRFNGAYSRDNLPCKIKDGAYVINLDEYADIGTHWIDLHKLSNNVTYFASFVEHIPKEIKKFIDGSVISASIVTTNIFRIQAHNSVMCGCFCIEFIDFVLNGKSSADFTDLFFRRLCKKNDDIVLNY